MITNDGIESCPSCGHDFTRVGGVRVEISCVR
mgnify:CR=1 FL=1